MPSILSGHLGNILWSSQREQCVAAHRHFGYSSNVPSPSNDVMFWNDQSISVRSAVFVMDEWLQWIKFVRQFSCFGQRGFNMAVYVPCQT